MQWTEAKNLIAEKIRPGMNINTPQSNFRIVLDTPSQNHQNYFVVRIGTINTIRISWPMLEQCFILLTSDVGYSGQNFRDVFPKQGHDHPCYVHAIGQMFIKAGIARQHKSTYRISVRVRGHPLKDLIIEFMK